MEDAKELDDDSVDEQLARYYQTFIVPSIILGVSYVLETVTNIAFGNWIARSRYLENIIDKMTKGRGHTSLRNLVWVIYYIAPAIAVFGQVLPQSVAFFHDPDGFNKNAFKNISFLVIMGVAYLLNLAFMFLWLWICFECYCFTQKFIDDHFKHTNLAGRSKEHKIEAVKRAMQHFVDNITLMHEISSPWTVSMIIRLMCNMYRFWFQLKQTLALSESLSSDGSAGDGDGAFGDKGAVQGAIALYITSLFFQMGMMLLVTFASGYVGDVYVQNVVKSLRTRISHEDDDTVSKASIDFLMLSNFYKGEAGLLFCGVEMGTEKAFYLVTALTYINSYFITPTT